MANKAKPASLAGMVLMAVWVAGWSTWNFLTGNIIPIEHILYSGAAIAAAFSPAYVSIWLDKIAIIKWGPK